MAAEHAAPHPPAGDGAPHAAHPHVNYVKIWAILCVLLAVSLVGPLFHVTGAIPIFIAFSIAFVKAYMVATNFMHLNIEKKIVWYILGAMLTLMLIMLGGVAPDVLKHEGARWSNDAAKASVEKGLHAKAEHEGEEH